MKVCQLREHAAQTMERLHAIISWSDPHATGMFVAGCVVVAVLIAVLSWPLVQATAVCFLVSAPAFWYVLC